MPAKPRGLLLFGTLALVAVTAGCQDRSGDAPATQVSEAVPKVEPGPAPARPLDPALRPPDLETTRVDVVTVDRAAGTTVQLTLQRHNLLDALDAEERDGMFRNPKALPLSLDTPPYRLFVVTSALRRGDLRLTFSARVVAQATPLGTVQTVRLLHFSPLLATRNETPRLRADVLTRSEPPTRLVAGTITRAEGHFLSLKGLEGNVSVTFERTGRGADEPFAVLVACNSEIAVLENSPVTVAMPVECGLGLVGPQRTAGSATVKVTVRKK